MIVWGSGGDTLDLGVVEENECETCERQRPFHLVLQYSYFGFYWLFNFVTEKQYMLLCEICQRGWELETSGVEPHLAKVPIPFRHRWSLLTLVAVVGGVVGALGLLGAAAGP